MTWVEVQARRFLWLFPAWLRSSRGEEAVSLVLDLLPAGARRLTVRARLDLVRAGLHARRIGCPPLSVWVVVLTASPRNRGGLVPEAWRPWLAERLRHPAFLWWTSATRVAPLVLPSTTVATYGSPMPWPQAVALQVAVVAGLSLAVCLVGGGRWRRDLLAKNGYCHDGRLAAPHQARLVERRPAWPNLSLSWIALATAVAGALLVLLGGFGVARGSHLWAIPTLVLVAILGLPAATAWVWVARGIARPHQASGRPVQGERTWSNVVHAAAPPVVPAVLLALVPQLTGGAPFNVLAGASMLFAGAALGAAAVRARSRTGHPIGLWDVLRGLGPVPTFVWRAVPPPPVPRRGTGGGPRSVAG